jgi:hypothetical protein
VALGLHVAGDWLDVGSTPQFALDGAEHARFWPEMKTRRGFSVSRTAVSLVDIGPLDLAAVSLWVSSMTSRRMWPSYGLLGNALASAYWPRGPRAAHGRNRASSRAGAAAAT